MALKKWKKKILWFLLAACVIASGVDAYYLYKTQKEQADSTEKKMAWITERVIPETVRPGSYLAALNAVFYQDLGEAASLYLKTEQGDPENKKLLKESYLFNAVLGRFDEIRSIVSKLHEAKTGGLFVPYVQATYEVKKNDWKSARTNIEGANAELLNQFLNPLLKAWTYAGEKQFDEAIKALAPLKEDPGLLSYYFYHRGLIALTMQLNEEADSAFQELAKKDLMALSLYPEIKTFYLQKKKWNVDNPFFVKLQLFEAQQPATTELIMRRPPRVMTPIRGMAEAFYNSSTALGTNKAYFEKALILSGLSLFLEQKQELPKIWSAEVLEAVKRPELAAHYYKQLAHPLTQTVAFKKASNLIAIGKTKEALSILVPLRASNERSTPLWMALASAYQKEENWPAAIAAYSKVLSIEGESNREYASDIYFMRAFIYTEQKQLALAEADLKHALDLNPKNPKILNHLGYQWLEKDVTMEKGFDLVEQAYKLDASDPHIVDSMAYGYYRKANYKKALPLAEKTVDKMPQSSVANAHLGDVYLALGRRREAIFQYNKALALSYDLTPELKTELIQKVEKLQASR